MIDEDFSIDELYQAYLDCRKHKKNKIGTMSYRYGALLDLSILLEEINNQTYELKPSTCFIIDYPAPREVFCADFRDRIVQHLVYNELNPIIEKDIIRDTCSCRVGKGTDYAIRRCEQFLRRETENYTKPAYVLKMDISGFFMSVEKKRLLDIINDLIETKYTGRHKTLVKFLSKIIIMSDITKDCIKKSPLWKWKILPDRKTMKNNGKGMPIGNVTSQLFVNYYLNFLDHKIKSRHKSYVRYVDDIIVIDKDRFRLYDTKSITNNLLHTINMKLSDIKSYVIDSKYGFKFLGVIIKPYYTILGSGRIGRMYDTIKDLCKTDIVSSLNSRKGMLMRYSGKRLQERWFKKIISTLNVDIILNKYTRNFEYKGALYV